MKQICIERWCLIIAVAAMLALPLPASAVSEKSVRSALTAVNEQLALRGASVRIEKVEFQTFNEVGFTVYANDRTHQMDSHWVPYDPRRRIAQENGDREIRWLVDGVDMPKDVADSSKVMTAVRRAMNTWNSVPGASIPLIELPPSYQAFDWGFFQHYYWVGGCQGWAADYTHAGWLPGAFFDGIGGDGGSQVILGATFTFIWVANGVPTDIDHNGKTDVSFRETYYNDDFPWGINLPYFDIETVVLHEAGHGLSLDHFGKIFKTAKGKIDFAPRAVMNALYFDVRHELLGTDLSSFYSIWASWPKR